MRSEGGDIGQKVPLFKDDCSLKVNEFTKYNWFIVNCLWCIYVFFFHLFIWSSCAFVISHYLSPCLILSFLHVFLPDSPITSISSCILWSHPTSSFASVPPPSPLLSSPRPPPPLFVPSFPRPEGVSNLKEREDRSSASGHGKDSSSSSSSSTSGGWRQIQLFEAAGYSYYTYAMSGHVKKQTKIQIHTKPYYCWIITLSWQMDNSDLTMFCCYSRGKKFIPCNIFFFGVPLVYSNLHISIRAEVTRVN